MQVYGCKKCRYEGCVAGDGRERESLWSRVRGIGLKANREEWGENLLVRTVVGVRMMVKEWEGKVYVEEVGGWNGTMDRKGGIGHENIGREDEGIY